MTGREENGQFKKGEYKGGPGRPKRTDEEKFNAVLLAVVTPTRFRTAVEKQMVKAEKGDLESFKYICKLLGLEVEKKQIGNVEGRAFLIEYVNSPYPTAEVPSSAGRDLSESEEI